VGEHLHPQQILISAHHLQEKLLGLIIQEKFPVIDA
jgi:hypothetical protein